MFIFLFAAIINIGAQKIEVEIADTPALQKNGLMFRDKIPENFGMLFVYKEPQMLCFWMKQTKIPLSIAFFNSKKDLVQIEDMNPPTNESLPLPLYKSKVPCQYALEMPQGWFKKNNISFGDNFTWQDSD